MNKKLALLIILLISNFTLAFADVTISPLPFINLQSNIFPSEIKREIENAYSQAMHENIILLTEGLSSKKSSTQQLAQTFYLKNFGEQLSSPTFSTLLPGYQTKILDDKKRDAYLIILNIISGVNGKSYGVNSVIHIWIHNKQNNKITLFIPDSKSFVKMIN